jgi:drug/metabolite transporter (DMT)-like permease
MIGDSKGKDILLLNIAMLFISTSGVLGRYISMSPEATIFWRSLFAAAFFFLILLFRRNVLRSIPIKTVAVTIVSGVLMAMHWVLYFYSLKWSSVAIGMLSLFTYPVITSILEPILLNIRFHRIHLLLGLLTLIGIYFLVPDTGLTEKNTLAICLGVLSALCYSLRNILMKSPIRQYDGTYLMFVQVTISFLVLLPFIAHRGYENIHEQWMEILFLAVFTTVIGHTLFLLSFRKFSISTASIMSCTQPVYGIILGVIFLQEYPAWSTYLGGTLILTAVVFEAKKYRAVRSRQLRGTQGLVVRLEKKRQRKRQLPLDFHEASPTPDHRTK